MIKLEMKRIWQNRQTNTEVALNKVVIDILDKTSSYSFSKLLIIKLTSIIRALKKFI